MGEIFAILSVVVILFGAPFYLIDILKHRTKPQRTTWLIWSVQGLIAFYAQIQLHAHWSLLFIGLIATGNLLVYTLSLFYGVGGWSRLEMLALSIAAIGLIISVAAKAPLIAVIGVIVADLAGVLPTLHKVYKDPSSETTITWVALGVSSVLTMAAVGNWNIKLLIYPTYLAVANFGVLTAQILGRSAHNSVRD